MKEASIKKNFIMNVMYTLGVALFPTLSFPYVSRILMAEGVGKVTLAWSVISYFNILAQLGIPTYGIRACARVRDDREKLSKVVWELFFLNMIMCIISYALLFTAVIMVERFSEERGLYIVESSFIVFSLLGTEWLYKGVEDYEFITISSMFFKIIACILLFFLVRGANNYIIYGALYVFAASASGVCNFINLHKYVDSPFGIGKLEIFSHIKPVLVFFAMTCATTIYTNLDTVMLGLMTTDAEVGYYNAAIKVKVLLVSGVTSLGAVLLPRASKFIKDGKIEEFNAITQKALKFVFFTALPLFVYFTLFAGQTILLLSGKGFERAVVPMQILLPTVLLIGITNILGIQVLVPLGREKEVLHSVILGALLDCIINALLIPWMSSVGAAVGTLLAEVLVLLYQCFVLRNELQGMIKKIPILRIAFGTFTASLASIGLLLLEMHPALLIVLSFIVFGAVYLLTEILLRVLSKDDLFGYR